MLLCISGMSGSGKTALAAALAEALPRAVHLDSDRIRKEIWGVSEMTRLPPEAYDLKVTERMVAEICSRIEKNLGEGKTVVVSSLLPSAEERGRQERLAKKCGAAFVGIWLKTDLQILLNRAGSRTNNPSDAGAEVIRMQLDFVKEPVSENWRVIDAGQPEDAVLREALKIVSPS